MWLEIEAADIHALILRSGNWLAWGHGITAEDATDPV
jgi:hypothetical protein